MPPKKEDYILSMGRIWDQAKNVNLLLQAAPHVQAKIKIAGENKHTNNYLAVPQRNVDYLGLLNSEQVALQLSSAAIYCLPAKYEPFGLSVLEAALSGCALVLGDIPSLKEVWGKNALYVNTDNHLELADVLNYLIKNKEVSAEYGKKAYVQAQKYSPNNMAESYLNLYHQLVQKENQPSKAIA